MKFTKEHELFSKVVEKALENNEFKEYLISNPLKAIEEETGVAMQLHKDQRIVVRDQSDEAIVYLNIPSIDNM